MKRVLNEVNLGLISAIVHDPDKSRLFMKLNKVEKRLVKSILGNKVYGSCNSRG